MAKTDNPTHVGSSGETESSAKEIVEVTNLSKQFGDVKAVNEANFDVYDGEFFSIIGPSGSGKTTLLRMIAGFEEPTSGTISIGGRECTYDKPYHRNTNMIFQNLALFPHLNVEENVEYGLVEAGVDKTTRAEKVEEALRTVDLSGYQSRRADELSGGEQQRVALARGLINEPSVLLLDEPLASLDEKLKETMKVELKRIQERTGTTFVYVTHDQEVAMAMSDRIAVLNKGELQQVDTPQEIYNNPANTFIADFTGAENIFEVSLVERSGRTGTVRLGDLEFETVLSEAVAAGDTDEYRLVLRPEEVSLSDGEGRVSGTVSELVYKGALMDVNVEVDVGTGSVVFRAEVHSEDAAGLASGDTVGLDWRADSPLMVTA
ncbi:ABC transporter ATP-binding protein [Salinigranum sp. GCM10025319]|uniref:ABC transporter ATP-binding protein n=1 Tax=Salinigranum sp. GCM10025319 TaxID=3252687 RepID=UPI00361F646C